MNLVDKGENFKFSKTWLKWHDREERITRFLTAQTTRQTELRIERYKRSKFKSNLVKKSKGQGDTCDHCKGDMWHVFITYVVEC
jgi:hypothetical protein